MQSRYRLGGWNRPTQDDQVINQGIPDFQDANGFLNPGVDYPPVLYPDNSNEKMAERNVFASDQAPLSDADYRAMLGAVYGQNAQVLARLQNLINLAEDRSRPAQITSTNFNVPISIPNGDMRSLIVSRPTLSELTTTFSTAIVVIIDELWAYEAPNPGITVIPLVSGNKTYRVNTAVAANQPPGGWVLPLLFRNYPYPIYP